MVKRSFLALAAAAVLIPLAGSFGEEDAAIVLEDDLGADRGAVLDELGVGLLGDVLSIDS